MLWISLIGSAASLATSFLQINPLNDLMNGEVTYEEVSLYFNLDMAMGFIELAILIITAVIFIQWFRRAYYNLHLISKGLNFTEGWAAGAWFVPIVNLYRPYHIMKELYEHTKVMLKDSNPSIMDTLKMSKVGLWWFFWIVSNILGQVLFRMARKAETLESMLQLNNLYIIDSIIGILLALLAIRVVRSYSNVEGLLQSLKNSEEKISDSLIEE